MNATCLERATESTLSTVAARPLANGRILLAEDDLEMRNMLAWALKREGYLVQECHDGASLQKWIDRSRSRSSNVEFDMVISDIRMPGLTGLDVLREVQGRSLGLPMILISAFCDQETRELARRLGAAELLSKPFETEDLVARVKQLMRRHIFIETAATAEIPEWDADDPTEEPSFPLEITFRHHQGTADQRREIQRLAARLERFGEPIHRCRVVVDRHGAGEGSRQAYNISLVLSTGHRPLVVEEDGLLFEDPEELGAALRQVFEAAGRRLADGRIGR